jgi:molybdopterin-guanine dinucleotide biosynthesis protein
MAIIVIGGHSRSVGKTSVVAGLISALPEFNWTAMKITQYGHGICSANGEPCDCVTDDHTRAITEEQDRSGKTDTSRFLVAGAKRSIWVRTRQGMLAEAMPDIRKKITGAENAIIESNSVIRYLRPDLYLTVLDSENPDFKESAMEFLDRADGVILHKTVAVPKWSSVSLKPVARRPFFVVEPPMYVNPEIVEFVRERITPKRHTTEAQRHGGKR